jgi:hypothetical protein
MRPALRGGEPAEIERKILEKREIRGDGREMLPNAFTASGE